MNNENSLATPPESKESAILDFKRFLSENAEQAREALSDFMGRGPKDDEISVKARELDAKERLLNERQLEMDTARLMTEKGISASAAPLIRGSDMETVARNAELFLTEVKRALDEALASGHWYQKSQGIPGALGRSFSDGGDTKSAVKSIMRR
jgi:hypothetical protein